MKTVKEWENNFGEVRKAFTEEFMNEFTGMEWMKIKSVTITDKYNIIVGGWNEFIDIRKDS